MHYISGSFHIGGDIDWHESENDREGEGITISFSYYGDLSLRQSLTSLKNSLIKHEIAWLQPNRAVVDDWIINTSLLLETFSLKDEFPWLGGKIRIRPEYEKHDESSYLGGEFWSSFRSSIQFVLLRDELEGLIEMIEIPELATFIEAFRADYPDPSTCAFIMMRFADTDLHKACLNVVRDVCSGHNIVALRADDKHYADDLLPNVRTYMHGCGFGIAIFERLIKDDFNPNVSLEVGYMMALGKPVLLLKDQTLGTLQTDLIGRLYSVFDTQNPETTIPSVVEKWFRDKAVI
ncbi:MAG: hypothetical protein JRI67_12240 [Deltaproteobacteria bacterium]|nr:hypothetical protein [Deltaproteobacteria bacterium]